MSDKYVQLKDKLGNNIHPKNLKYEMQLEQQDANISDLQNQTNQLKNNLSGITNLMYHGRVSQTTEFEVDNGFYLLYLWVLVGTARTNSGLYTVVVGSDGQLAPAVSSGSANVSISGKKIKITAPYGNVLEWNMIKLCDV